MVFTKKDTNKYQEVLQHPNVNVAYVGKSFVSIRGKAEIVENKDKKQELWSAGYDKFMQTTYDDPNVVLIKVNTEAAEYWETGNLVKKISLLYKRVTGKDAESTNINETIEMK